MQATAADFIRRKPVVTVGVTASPAEAAKRMRDLGVGCLVALGPNDRPVGMVTDRDLALRVVGAPIEPDSVTVRSVMSTPLASVAPEDPLEAVTAVMERRGVRRVPIVHHTDGLVGIITLDDLLQDAAREMHDLSKETQTMMRWAKRAGALERMADNVDAKLRDAQTQMQYVKWYAGAAFLDKIDELRERIVGTFKT